MDREYAYIIRVEDEESQAGVYSGGRNDGQAVKAGKGVKGRLTGGMVTAATEKEAKEKIQAEFTRIKRSPHTNADGSVTEKTELVELKIHFLDLNARGVIIPDV